MRKYYDTARVCHQADGIAAWAFHVWRQEWRDHFDAAMATEQSHYFRL